MTLKIYKHLMYVTDIYQTEKNRIVFEHDYADFEEVDIKKSNTAENLYYRHLFTDEPPGDPRSVELSVLTKYEFKKYLERGEIELLRKI